jgi:hypothetical protein
MTWGSPPSMTDTTELVVPRSIPTALAMPGPPGIVLLVRRWIRPGWGRAAHREMAERLQDQGYGRSRGFSKI